MCDYIRIVNRLRTREHARIHYARLLLTLRFIIVCGRATSSVRSKAEPWNEGGDGASSRSSAPTEEKRFAFKQVR